METTQQPGDESPREATPPTKTKNIHEAIAAVMAEVGGVAKGRKNVQQNYNFRGIADVYLACQPIMAKHGMHVCPEEIIDYAMDELTTKSGGQMWRVRIKVRHRAWASDGTYVDVVTLGEAMDTGDKASNKAMSVSMKYCLVQLFALPEEDPTVDTETASPETVAQPRAPQPAPQVNTKALKVHKLVEVLTKAGKSAGAEQKAWMATTLGRAEVKASSELTEADLDKLIAEAGKLGGAA